MTILADIPLTTIDGSEASLADYDGQVILVVNVASRCGLTPQYAGLEALYRRYHDEGFVVLGFPSNDFRGQEPGTNVEIADFCRTTYDIGFPMFGKIAVVGEDQHPLYRALTEAAPAATGGEAMRERLRGHGIDVAAPPAILWNFEKFLIGRDGNVVERFTPDTAPDDERLTRAIERELFASE